MATESLAALSSISGGMFAGGAVAFGVAALVLGFVRRTRRRTRVTQTDVTGRKIPWAQEGDENSQYRDVLLPYIGRKGKRAETYVNPVDIWSPSDLERGLDRIPGPPTLLKELDTVEHEGAKSELLVDVEISPVSSSGRAVCTYPGCNKSFAKQCDLNKHTTYHDKPKTCPTCPKSFATTKDLNRHINSVHQTTKKYYCTVAGCKHAKITAAGVEGASFARKDNRKRHMRDKHGRTDEELGQVDGMDIDE